MRRFISMQNMNNIQQRIRNIRNYFSPPRQEEEKKEEEKKEEEKKERKEEKEFKQEEKKQEVKEAARRLRRKLDIDMKRSPVRRPRNRWQAHRWADYSSLDKSFLEFKKYMGDRVQERIQRSVSVERGRRRTLNLPATENRSRYGQSCPPGSERKKKRGERKFICTPSPSASSSSGGDEKISTRPSLGPLRSGDGGGDDGPPDDDDNGGPPDPPPPPGGGGGDGDDDGDDEDDEENPPIRIPWMFYVKTILDKVNRARRVSTPLGYKKRKRKDPMEDLLSNPIANLKIKNLQLENLLKIFQQTFKIPARKMKQVFEPLLAIVSREDLKDAFLTETQFFDLMANSGTFDYLEVSALFQLQENEQMKMRFKELVSDNFKLYNLGRLINFALGSGKLTMDAFTKQQLDQLRLFGVQAYQYPTDTGEKIGLVVDAINQDIELPSAFLDDQVAEVKKYQKYDTQRFENLVKIITEELEINEIYSRDNEKIAALLADYALSKELEYYTAFALAGRIIDDRVKEKLLGLPQEVAFEALVEIQGSSSFIYEGNTAYEKMKSYTKRRPRLLLMRDFMDSILNSPAALPAPPIAPPAEEAVPAAPVAVPAARVGSVSSSEEQKMLPPPPPPPTAGSIDSNISHPGLRGGPGTFLGEPLPPRDTNVSSVASVASIQRERSAMNHTKATSSPGSEPEYMRLSYDDLLKRSEERRMGARRAVQARLAGLRRARAESIAPSSAESIAPSGSSQLNLSGSSQLNLSIPFSETENRTAPPLPISVDEYNRAPAAYGFDSSVRYMEDRLRNIEQRIARLDHIRNLRRIEGGESGGGYLDGGNVEPTPSPAMDGNLFTETPVDPEPPDPNLRIINQDAENKAIVEQRQRESLTSLSLVDLLALNDQNKTLPVQLRRSRNLYAGGPKSGFSDPLTNPFSKFVYKAKADKYYVYPTESVNTFRRSKARQALINTAVNEHILYPKAAQELKLKEEMDYPQSKKAKTEAAPDMRLVRPSYNFVRNGINGIRNAPQRFYQLPHNPNRLTNPGSVEKDQKSYTNRVSNFVTCNTQEPVQNAEAVWPFIRQRYLQ